MTKKTILILLVFCCVLIGVINYRIPFFKPVGGPWSIGFGYSENYPDSINFTKNKVYSYELVKKYIDSTQFIADPFFIKEKDSFYIFFEHKKIDNYYAGVGLLTSKDGYNYQYKGTVLKERFHLSYPQVFKHKNEFYMLPESQGANHVLLYKAKNFPYKWTVCDTLLPNTRLKDPTIYLSDTLNVLVGCDQNFKMHMYQSDKLQGNWKLHSRPIVMEGSESRPGGRILADKNGLFLPVQSFHEGYGSGLSIYHLQFKNNTYTVKRNKHLLLQSQKNIKEFNAGMHHLDIQKIDNHYYCVYDGNQLEHHEKTFNYKAPILLNCLDFKDWIRQNIIY